MRLHTNRATCFAVSTVGSLRLDATGFDGAPANDGGAARLPAPVRWIHVASEGDYRGHSAGQFALTSAVFAEMVRNLRADPKYAPGSIEVEGATINAGTRGVVQYDYEHASEMPPFEGSIPTSGAPAIGWVLDLDMRKGADGRAQLWALSKLGEQIRGQISREEYTSVSIAWNPKGIHWQTGKPIGAVLTSVAFTNHPFLRDLQLIAATSRAGQPAAGAVQPGAQSTEAHAGGPITTQRDPMELRVRLCTLYRLNPQADDDSVIRAAENAATTGGNLATVLQALGVADASAALAAIPDLVAAKAKLAEAQAELDSLMQADRVSDEAVAEQDVAQAMAARNWRDVQAAAAVKAHRQSIIDGEVGKLASNQRGPKDVRAARERGRTSFLATYGVNLNPAQQHLSQTFVAGPGLAGPHTQYMPPTPAPAMFHAPQGHVVTQQLPNGQVQVLQPLQLSQQPQQQQPGQIDLSAYTGRNTTERIMSYLASVDGKFSELPLHQRINRASAWRKQHLQEFAA